MCATEGRRAWVSPGFCLRVHFFPKKDDDLFSVVALKRWSKTIKWTTPTSKISPPSKNVLKLTLLCLRGEWWTWCAEGVPPNLPCKLRLKFFLRPGGCRCTQCTPWLRLCRRTASSCNASQWLSYLVHCVTLGWLRSAFKCTLTLWTSYYIVYRIVSYYDIISSYSVRFPANDFSVCFPNRWRSKTAAGLCPASVFPAPSNVADTVR